MGEISINVLNEWWNHTPFWVMENITGLDKEDFNPQEGYQEFVDVCDNWWNSLSFEDKQGIYLDWN